MLRSLLYAVVGACFLLASTLPAEDASAQGNKPRIIQLASNEGGPENGSMLLWRNSQPGPTIRKFLHLQIHELGCQWALDAPQTDRSYALYLRTSALPGWLRVYNFNTDCQTDGVTAWTVIPQVDGDDEFWFTDQEVEAEIRIEADDGVDGTDAILSGFDALD